MPEAFKFFHFCVRSPISQIDFLNERVLGILSSESLRHFQMESFSEEEVNKTSKRVGLKTIASFAFEVDGKIYL